MIEDVRTACERMGRYRQQEFVSVQIELCTGASKKAGCMGVTSVGGNLTPV